MPAPMTSAAPLNISPRCVPHMSVHAPPLEFCTCAYIFSGQAFKTVVYRILSASPDGDSVFIPRHPFLRRPRPPVKRPLLARRPNHSLIGFRQASHLHPRYCDAVFCRFTVLHFLSRSQGPRPSLASDSIISPSLLSSIGPTWGLGYMGFSGGSPTAMSISWHSLPNLGPVRPLVI